MPHPQTGTERCKLPRAFWQAVEQLGLSPSSIQQHARLPRDLHLNEAAMVSTGELFAVWNAIEALSADPAFAIKMVRDTPTAKHKLAFLAALYAADFRDGLARLSRFKRLCSPDRLCVDERNGTVSLTIQWPAGTGPEPYLSVEACFALILELGRRGTGKHLVPLALRLRRPRQTLDTHAGYFGCAIRYGAAHDQLILSTADIDLPFNGHNPEVLHFMTPGLTAAVQEIEAPVGFREQVIGVLKRALAGGRPSVQQLARTLLQSERTLQRRLASHGTTFSELLNEARREVGFQLLADQSLELKEVAYLLGYQDVTSYHRAFRQYEKVSPGEWRRLNG
ncbi:Ornithine utilization regulator [Pseudomonas reidholzensis]|uniref:Ornithine utilization regulator n=1 Tax=Pseudomonas reidholzensis TaxID=1785162 RepID=A0A383RQX0_9PSED|nr:AraC family transcriptional regulator [Pseudomonas reidholzensis]SYX89054.1 Ornithine utilization regulator [Pseudomonas reidholzensis]